VKAGTDHDSAIRAGVRAIMEDMRNKIALVQVEERGVDRFKKIFGPDETPAEKCRRENAEGLRWIAAFGNARGSALRAARRVSPGDPSAHHRLSQRFLRILREKK
jgi:hypothetical protein